MKTIDSILRSTRRRREKKEDELPSENKQRIYVHNTLCTCNRLAEVAKETN
jgi:hypothetical protein